MGGRFFPLSCLLKLKHRENGGERESGVVLVPPPHYPSMPRYPIESRGDSSRQLLGIRKTLFKVSGMQCSACAASIEKAVKRLEGIEDATVDVLHSKAQVVYHPSCVDMETIMCWENRMAEVRK